MATCRNVLITGASGGLGGALARHYARPGVRLSLWGRDGARLAAIAAACREQGALADVVALDLTDTGAMLEALAAQDEATPFDLAILAAGRGDVRAPGARVEDPALVARMVAVNLAAPAAMAAALGDRMAARGGGSLVLVGSAAAFHALPFAAAYAGTKAGLARFAGALRLGLHGSGVRVTLVSPGFIDTDAARRIPGPKPMVMTPADAAARIARTAERGAAHVVMPWPFAALRLFDRLLPRAWRDRLLLALSPPGR